MPAYLLLLAALLSRVIPHSGWYGFTAVGGALLYFGARRNWREMLLPVAAFAAVDYYLTTQVYSSEFNVVNYLSTWAWYAAAIALGHILLSARTSAVRFIAAGLLGPTSFFLISNFAAWQILSRPGSMYANNLGGLITAYIAGLPFYGRDVVSTGLVLALAFGAEATVRHFRDNNTLQPAPIRAKR
jgi:hypothetical protein